MSLGQLDPAGVEVDVWRVMQSAVLDGVVLDYEVRGVGEPVVLIHLAPYADSFLPLMDQPGLTRLNS
jgi:hypothetical protein